MAFDAKKHLIQLKGKWYLETKYRLLWMRDEHPDWRVGTEVVSLDPPLVKATVYDADGTVVATGHGGANDKGNAVWSGRAIEKAETAALGRALAHAGFGTQFLESDANHLADSPVADNGNGKPTNVKQAADKFKAAYGEQPPVGREEDDLRNRDTAADFIANTRKAGWEDSDVLQALGVAKLSDWTHGRKAAGERLQAWRAEQDADDDLPDLNAVWNATAKHWKARQHFDNWLAQQYPDGVVGLATDELIDAIHADRTAQGKADAAFEKLGAFS